VRILHTARQTTALSCQFGCQCLEHPQHSPDLAPRDFDLIGRLTKLLGSHRFQDAKEFQKAAPQWFRLQSPGFRAGGIQSQTTRCDECLNLQVDYDEKYVIVPFSR
jgi:hypothetical protein